MPCLTACAPLACLFFHLNIPSCEMGCSLSLVSSPLPSVQRKAKTPVSQMVTLPKQCRRMELSCQWVTGVERSRNGVLPRREIWGGESHSNFCTTCFGCEGNLHTPLVRLDHWDNREGLARLEKRYLPPSPVP